MTTRSVARNNPLLALATALAMLLVPWATAQEGGESQAGGGQDARAGLRFANLVPEGTTVDVLVDGEVRVEDLAPSSVSRYLFLPPGEHTVEVVSRAAAADAAVGAEGVDVDPEAPPAADDPAAADPTAPAAPAAPAGAPMAPEATEDVDADALRDAPLLQQSVDLQAETYGTLLLFRTMEGASPAASGDAAQPDEAQQQAADEAEEQAPEPAAEDAGDAAADAADAAGDAAADAADGAADGDADAPQDADAQAADAAAGQTQQQVPALQGRLIQDPISMLPGAGMSLVRVVHAAPNAGAVTVVAARQTPEAEEQAPEEPAAAGDAAADAADAADGDADAQAAEDAAAEGAPAQEGPTPIDGEALASGLTPDDAADYVTLRSGPHHVQVQVEDGTVAVDLEDVVFEAGLVYTLYVASTDEADVITLTPAVDAGVSSEAR